MPLQWRWVCSKVFTILIVTILAIAGQGCGAGSHMETGGTGDRADADETDPTFRVPNGSPKKIHEFAKVLLSRKPQFTDPVKQRDDSIKTVKALIRAGNKILAQKADEATLTEAAVLKLSGTIKLALLQADDDQLFESNARDALAVVSEMRQDKRPVVAHAANDFWIIARSLKLNSLSTDERTALADEAYQRINQQFSPQKLGETYFLVEQFLKFGDFDHGTSLLEKMAATLAKSDEEEYRGLAPQLTSRAKLLRLCGKPIEIEGRLLEGGDLDWKSYRGKVVLVDFWATWCVPCLNELPSVKANYQKYHSLGFDVVGISIDHDRNALRDFLKSERLPWVQIFDNDFTESRTRQHTMAKKLGVSTIPRAILVDQNGIVVSVETRGEELDRLLAKMLGSKDTH